MTFHQHGSSNPLGVNANEDRIPFHPYLVFKDLVTVFLFLLALSIIVCFYPNVLGHSEFPNVHHIRTQSTRYSQI